MSVVITPIKGRTYKFKVSPDSWTTTYILVCLITQSMSASRSVTKQDTQCGVVSGRGSIDRTYELQFLCNTTPDAPSGTPLTGEVSYKLWLTWFEGEQALKFKLQDPDGSGTNLHQEGNIYIDEVRHEAAVDGNLLVTTTVSVDGVLDIAP